MKSVYVALFVSVVACVFVQPVLAAEATKTKEKVLHSFGSGTDGQDPTAGLIDVKGTLYGTTYGGGASNSGTVFALDPSTGAETVLYSFCSQQNCADGAHPHASLIDLKGTLYGTTGGGGENCQGSGGCGTVFALDPNTGKETVLYSFCNQVSCTDGEYPFAGNLIAVNGILYGTTQGGGGASNGGTVFALDLNTDKESVLYSFCSQQNCTDGDTPTSGLIDVNGTLYGTTYGGGTSDLGTVFALDPNTNKETVLYSFCSQQNCTDGRSPYAGLIDVNGTLYGTTQVGGASGDGTVFALDLSTGAETVLYSFCSQQNCTDGANPFTGSLIDVKGALYGTTQNGGDSGSGTVFALDANTGKERVLYSFCSHQSCTDGAGPYANVIDVKRTLYGTTLGGGANDNCYNGGGCGTVFSLKP